MPETRVNRLVREIVASPKNHCFVCSPTNAVGLRLRFERQEGVVRSRFVPETWHEGWEGIVHGGILAAVLDEAMAYTVFFDGVKGMTARIEVRYRGAVHQGDVLDVEARTVRDTRKLAEVEGRLLRDGAPVAEATGRYMKLGSLDPDVSA